MQDELRERLRIIQGFVDMAPLDSDELCILRMRKADCFNDLAAEVSRLEAENERLRETYGVRDWTLRQVPPREG